MIEEIGQNLYMLKINLPRNPLKCLNSYVIKGTDRNLVIDTGMNREECINDMERGLKDLRINLDKTDFFITHFHADHSGLVSYLKTPGSRVFCGWKDAYHINLMTTEEIWTAMGEFLYCHGFPRDELDRAISHHPGYKYRNKEVVDFYTVKEGSVISCGSYRFQCIETPGHTRGHICLYEPDKKILVAGDHILGDITPNITAWSDQENPLKDYLESLQKIRRLELELVLPGHRGVISDPLTRINELEYHHRARLEEIMEIVKSGPQDAYHVAAQMQWDIQYASWEDFPPQQKLFATGEAISHLRYLEEAGCITRDIKEKKRGKKILFYLAS